MARSRLTQALEEGAVELPENGSVAVYWPPKGYDLSAIDKERVLICTGFKPDFDAWENRGYTVGTSPIVADAALILVQKSRAATLATIYRAVAALNVGATVLVDGQKDTGIDTVLKTLKKATDLSPAFSKAHGKIASFKAGPLPDKWAAAPEMVEGYYTAHSGFSAGAIDPGSEILVQVMPELRGKVADLGAGWGFLSKAALKSEHVQSIDLIEADYDSLKAAEANISDPRAQFCWADAKAFAGGPYDVILSNPPFHTGRHADPELGRTFIRTAGRLLNRHGRFLMVANRHLPYEATLTETFGQVEEIGGSSAFKVISATRPRAAR